MIDYLLHFFSYNRIYLYTGAALLLLVILPTKGKVSPKTRKALYLLVVIWILCFAYRMNTGKDITGLINRGDDFADQPEPAGIKGGPFNKYYSNDAGRNPKN